MALRKIDAPYSRAEAWTYDALIADAVHSAMSGVLDNLAAELPTDAHLVEVGCGGGQFAVALAERNDTCRVTGIDLSAQQVARAEARAKAEPSAVSARLDFAQGSALALGFPDNHFDAALSIASIKHWPDRPRGLAEMVRVVKPGARVVIVEIDRGAPRSSLCAWSDQMRVPRVFRGPFIWGFTRFAAGLSIDLAEARELLAGTPLCDQQVQRHNEFPFLTMSGVKPV